MWVIDVKKAPEGKGEYLYTVGHYFPAGPANPPGFIALKSFERLVDAAQAVNFLNGGNPTTSAIGLFN